MTLGALTDSKFGCDIVVLLDLSLLKSTQNAANGPIRLGLHDFSTPEIAIATENLDGVALLQAIVCANCDFNELRTCIAVHGTYDAPKDRYDLSRRRVGVNAFRSKQACLGAQVLRQLGVLLQ